MPLNLTFFGTIDGASLLFLTFVVFFVGLVIYLRREDRREGYPLEDDVTGRLEPMGGLIFAARPKVFIMGGGADDLVKPDGLRESFTGSASRTSRAPGTPLVPTGDPMHAAIGPGAYAQRARKPDVSIHGAPKIVPLRSVPAYQIDAKSPDPRGMQIHGVDGAIGGLVTDVWIDRVEYIARYLEVAVTPVAGGPPIEAKRVLIPMPLCNVSRGSVSTHTVLGSQFAGAPALSGGDTVTFDEEERASAYFGGGLLYATATRSEPVL
jgi:photosynthetic reaction center H subunit